MSQRTVPHPVRPGGLDETDHERIHELAGEGLGSHKIARAIERHPSTVAWFMYREGLMVPKRRDLKPFTRGGQVIYPFSREEDAFIEALRIQHFSTERIAEISSKRFGHPRSVRAVQIRLQMLAALEEAA